MIQKKLIICPHCKYNVFWDIKKNIKNRTAWNVFVCSNWDCYYFDGFKTPIKLTWYEKMREMFQENTI